MKKETYFCDCGSVQVRCGDSYVRYENGYGDGTHKVYSFDSRNEFKQYVEEHKQYGIEEKDYRFLSTAVFSNAKVLNYDCYGEGRKDNENDVLFTLNGNFTIYCNYGKVYFVKTN